MPGRRLFVAVPIADAARDRIVELVEGLRDPGGGPGKGGASSRGRDVRWVRLEGLHLTLRFLGPTEDPGIPAVAEAVRRVATRSSPFEIAIDGGGAFPNEARPRTLWLGVTTGTQRLAGMAAELDGELETAGWPPSDRPFRAHLTLARTDGVAAGPAVARRLVDAARGLDLRSPVDRLVLYESVTGSGAARYLPVAETALGGGPGTPGPVPSDLTEPGSSPAQRSRGDASTS